MAAEAKSDAELVERSRQLLEQGLALQSVSGAVAPDADTLVLWDDAVNKLLGDVNEALTEKDFHSRSLQRHLELLTDLYQQTLSALAAERDDQAAVAANLHQQRWQITG